MNKIVFSFLFILLVNACALSSPSKPIEIRVVNTTTPIPTQTNTLTPIPTFTSTPTLTAMPQLFDVQLIVFWDYNGNGSMDAGEPPLENVVFMTGSDECVTGANGICTLEGVPAGNTLLGITAPANFRYITPDNITDVLLSKGYDISVTKDDSLLIPLAEGPYRNPFHEASQIKVIQWKDINLATCNGKQPDRTCGLRADWLGGANTYDGHDGTDIHISNAQKVYAMRKGEIHDIRLVTPDKSSDGYEVLIQDKNSLFDTNTSFTDIVHVRNLNPDIKLGSSVDPTTWIGTGASTLNGGKIHLSFYYDVPATRDPRDRPWITNPWNHCPFGEHLWVSLFQFGKIVNHDAIRDFDTIVRPPFLYIEGNIK